MSDTIIYKEGFPYRPYRKAGYAEAEAERRSKAFYYWLNERRSVRDFSNRPVPATVIETIVQAAATAPSGAHKQPWTFCIVGDPGLKKQIRLAAEQEEYESYNGRMPPDWLNDLKPLGTDWQKPFLETAPWLIIVFKRIFEYDAAGEKKNNYYVQESVGLACGMLLAAIHHAGLGALTHTPSPMNFLCRLLNRPDNEKPFLLIPVGYVAEDCYVPDIQRKPAEEAMVWY